LFDKRIARYTIKPIIFTTYGTVAVEIALFLDGKRDRSNDLERDGYTWGIPTGIWYDIIHNIE